MGKPAGGRTVRLDTGPYAAQRPYLDAGFQAAYDQLRSGGPSYYPHATLAPESPETQAARAAIATRAANGSPRVDAADQAVSDTLSGRYLEAGNPGFDALIGRVDNAVRPRIESGFESAGRYGSGAAANAHASALADAASTLAYQDYAAERQNQLRAAALAPLLAGQDYVDLAALAGAGASADRRAQAVIDDDRARFDFDQQRPGNALDSYFRLIGRNYGSSGSETQGANTGDLLGDLGQATRVASGLLGLF